MTKETTKLWTLRNNNDYGDNKQEDFRQQHVRACFIRVHSRTIRLGEYHHMHAHSHSTTRVIPLILASLLLFLLAHHYLVYLRPYLDEYF